MTKTGVYVRGFLYVSIAVVGYVIGDNTFRAAIPPLYLAAGGAVLAGLTTIRAYIDTSNGDSKKSPTDDTKEATQ